jgi:hypothetical protein
MTTGNVIWKLPPPIAGNVTCLHVMRLCGPANRSSRSLKLIGLKIRLHTSIAILRLMLVVDTDVVAVLYQLDLVDVDGHQPRPLH